MEPIKKFFQDVDKRSKKEMIDFLTSHFRYNTINSWNGSTSYANKVKIHSVIPSSLTDKVYELMESEDFYDSINYILKDWDEKNNYHYQAGFNGRSSGYIVMYEGYRKLSQHKSRCTSCWQRNFKSVPDWDTSTPEGRFKLYLVAHPMWTNEVYLRRDAEEVKKLNLSDEKMLEILSTFKGKAKEYSIDNKCGKCHKNSRVNAEMYETGTWPGRSIDQGEDFEEWDMGSLRSRVELIQSFDMMCDDVVAETIRMAEECNIVEEIVMIPWESYAA